ncbi:SLBB domain-containing protein [Sandaracinus amylolyticus]|uniref:SLBB domain-containing protein n=1 Tax=Sandaracinus amylolyticus TaxID=927083 RepID=UPI001F1C1E02|nr:SLBB domain-containing protein [Sandaracinus amylolyticus]UJR80260.1 Capsule polysaccharide export protein [Sandaracinus amylolyticus]
MTISSPFRRHWNLFSCVLTAAIAGSLGPGCSPNLPRTPTTPSEDARFQRADLTPPGMADDAAAAMQLYPGDVVTLRLISTETEEYEGLVVDERGVLHIPLAGDVPVGGLDLTDAERRVEEAMRQFDRTSRVSLVVSEPSGHFASVLGAVGTPGRVAVTPGMRLADLLAAAGGAAVAEEEGFSMPSGDLGGARLVRNGEALPISLEVALTGDPRHNIRVRPGDTLYVPADLGRLVSVLGQVGSPRIMAFRPGMRLTHALSLAGGVTRDGNWGDVRVIRGEASDPMVYSTSVAAIVDGDAHDVVLAPGDIVYVASAGHADLRDVMNSLSLLLSIPITAASITVPSLIIGSGR